MRQGIVSQIKEDEIVVTIKCASACHECTQKENCSLSEMRLKQIHLPVSDAQKYHIGQRVLLDIPALSMVWSLLLAYGFPLILMLITVLMASLFDYPETTCAISAIGILFPYYFCISKFNKWLKRKIAIKITENLVD